MGMMDWVVKLYEMDRTWEYVWKGLKKCFTAFTKEDGIIDNAAIRVSDCVTGVTKEDRLVQYARSGENNRLKRMLGRGANANVYDKEGSTPLHYTAANGNLEGTRLLIARGGKVDLTDAHNDTAVDLIAKFPHDDTQNETLYSDGSTALMCAAIYGRKAAAEELLKNECDYTRTNTNGETAFMLAFRHNHSEVAKAIRTNMTGVIKEKKPYTVWKDVPVQKERVVLEEVDVPVYDTVNVAYTEVEGGTIMTPHGRQNVGQYVTKYRDVQQFSHYEKQKVEKKEKYFERERQAFTEYKWERRRIAHLDELFSDDATVAKAVLSWGGDPDIKNSKGNSPLHKAVWSSNESLVSDLIRFGADVNACNGNKNTPLHWAANFPNVRIAKQLLDNGADVNARNAEGITPLHAAASKNRAEIVSLLLQRGARPQEKSNRGRTPSDLAGRDCKALILSAIETERERGRTPAMGTDNGTDHRNDKGKAKVWRGPSRKGKEPKLEIG